MSARLLYGIKSVGALRAKYLVQVAEMAHFSRTQLLFIYIHIKYILPISFLEMRECIHQTLL